MFAPIEGLIEKLRAGLSRHGGQPAPVLAEKIVRSAVGLATARVALRACDELGPRARSLGWAIVDNRGRMKIGADFAANCPFCAVELATAPGGVLTIGDQVVVNYGTSITAAREIRLGDRVSIGPYCILCDSDAPAPLFAPPGARSQPIVLEDDVWLAGRVTVLPGAHIGAGATVSAGSVVRGYIPPGTVASGIPARPLRVAPTRQAKAVIATPTARLRGLVLTDFPATELTARLRDEDPPFVDSQTELFDGASPLEIAPFHGDVAVVWTTAEGALPALREVLSGASGPKDMALTVERVLACVDANARLLAERLAPCPCVIVPTWVVAPELRTSAVARTLAVANARLAERLAEALPQARVLDASRFVGGAEAWSPIMMYSNGAPFSLGAFDAAARDIKDVLREARGEARTVLFLSRPPPPTDMASRAAAEDLERALSALRARGVVIHEAAPGCPPSPEALGLCAGQSVFLTTDAALRARAREAISGMLAPEISGDPLLLASAVRSLRVFGGA